MNRTNTSKITFIIFFALTAINTELFTSEKQRTLIQKFNIAATATAITITSLVVTPTLAENIEKKELTKNQNLLWNLLPEAFRRLEMCKMFYCSTFMENDAKKVTRACFDIDVSKTYDVLNEVSRSFQALTPEEKAPIKKELKIIEQSFYVLEKKIDDFSFEKILNDQTNKR